MREKEKREAKFAKGELVRAFAYYIDHGDPAAELDRPLVVMDSWWVSHEWSWVYDLYDPGRETVHFSVIEGLVRPLSSSVDNRLNNRGGHDILEMHNKTGEDSQ